MSRMGLGLIMILFCISSLFSSISKGQYPYGPSSMRAMSPRYHSSQRLRYSNYPWQPIYPERQNPRYSNYPWQPIYPERSYSRPYPSYSGYSNRSYSRPYPVYSGYAPRPYPSYSRPHSGGLVIILNLGGCR